MEQTKTGVKRGMAVLVTVARMLLGLVFMFSGTVKAIDPVGTQIKLGDYIQGMGLGMEVPLPVLLTLACLLAGFEILVGSYLVMGAFKRGTALVALLMMSVLTPFTLYVAIANPVHDCGCFGDAVVLTNTQTFLKNVVLLALAIVVWKGRDAGVVLVRERLQWTVTVAIVLVSARFMYDNVNRLPVIDFRPYSIGTDLRKQVLEGDNEQFSDFFLMDSELNDATASVLGQPGYTFLIVSPHLEEAASSDIDRLDDLSGYCESHGYGLYCLTASSSSEIARWTDGTGARYQFLKCDEIPLKTMVRSNPGLLLLKDGVIMGKWSHSTMPNAQDLTDPVEDCAFSVRADGRPLSGPVGVALLFILPLALIAILDKLTR